MIERTKVIGGTPTLTHNITWGTANRIGEVQDDSWTGIRTFDYYAAATW